MQMTVGEIQRNYSQAKNKSQQIGILADLNCCSREDIENIVKVENRREERKEPDSSGLQGVLDSLLKRLDALDQEIKAKEEEYRKISNAIEVLGNYL